MSPNKYVKNAHSNIVFTAYTNFAVEIINRKILPIGYIRKDRNLSEQIRQVLEQINWKEQQIVNVDKIFIDQKVEVSSCILGKFYILKVSKV